jgi:hypothetical protein
MSSNSNLLSNIRTTGSINDPLFCLVDVANYIGDVNYRSLTNESDKTLKKCINFRDGRQKKKNVIHNYGGTYYIFIKT